MNEAVTKRFLLYFRLMLLVWILIANAIIHPVSYTHLDVYKRQATTEIPSVTGIMTSFNRVGYTWAGGNYNMITGPVSYTHLCQDLHSGRR